MHAVLVVQSHPSCRPILLTLYEVVQDKECGDGWLSGRLSVAPVPHCGATVAVPDCPFCNAEWLRCDCPVGSRMQPELDYDEEDSVLVPESGTPCPLCEPCRVALAFKWEELRKRGKNG